MKNYLFAPFKDDDDKMNTWNSCKSGIDQGIMIFLGRLESTYDVIISKLSSENAVAIKDEEVIILLEDRIRDLKAEVKSLKADAKHDADVCYDVDDEHIKTIEELKAERDEFGQERDNNRKNIDILKAENVKAREYIAQVEEENDTLKYANTMYHAKEWFNNNPKCNKVHVFVLDADGVDDDGWIADSHAVASVKDSNCVGSYDRNTNG